MDTGTGRIFVTWSDGVIGVNSVRHQLGICLGPVVNRDALTDVGDLRNLASFALCRAGQWYATHTDWVQDITPGGYRRWVSASYSERVEKAVTQ